MNKKFLLTLATAIGITAAATTAMAAPLPICTKLTITKSPDGVLVQTAPCPNGSCFGMFLFPGLYAWTPLGSGTDGGIIVGKSQGSGEVTDWWNYNGNEGTFHTLPDGGTKNIFDDASCTGAGCGSYTTPRKTDLAVWNMAWGGQNMPLGSEVGCDQTVYPNCTVDMVAGIFVNSWTIDPVEMVPRKYSLLYSQVPTIVFRGYPFKLKLTGQVVQGDPGICGNTPPIVTVTPASLTEVYGVPIPFDISITDSDGPSSPTCRVGTSPANGDVVLDGCFSGTYTANSGFIGTDSFTLIANDGLNDSAPATVTAAITAPTTDTECTAQHPVTQTTITGKQGHLSVVVTGNIISVNPNDKEIKICPTTTATYEASTNTPGATVVCKVKSNTSRGKGRMKVNDHIKCTDKPVGNDKIHLKIKSGVNQKAM